MNEWQGPVWNDCGGCNYTRRTLERDDRPRWCVWCAADSLVALKTLAANLRIGAALCAVWQSTFDNSLQWVNGRAVLWHPGCGRPMTLDGEAGR